MCNETVRGSVRHIGVMPKAASRCWIKTAIGYRALNDRCAGTLFKADTLGIESGLDQVDQIETVSGLIAHCEMLTGAG